MTGTLDQLADTVTAGTPLTSAQAEQVIASTDVIAIGALADRCRHARHGRIVTFVRVQPLPIASDAPVARAEEAAGELRLTGAPASARDAVAAVERAVAVAGGRPVTGFVLNELAAACGGARLEALLRDLAAAGLAMLSEVRVADGGWKECLAQARKASLDVARLALGPGPEAEAVQRLRAVAGAGAAVAHVRTLNPLAARHAAIPTTGLRDVRRVALARLLVDNIPSIQVDWGREGPKLAQVALAFGADDLDGVEAADESPHGWRRSPRAEVERHIRAASLVPCSRNGRFERLEPCVGSG